MCILYHVLIAFRNRTFRLSIYRLFAFSTFRFVCVSFHADYAAHFSVWSQVVFRKRKNSFDLLYVLCNVDIVIISLWSQLHCSIAQLPLNPSIYYCICIVFYENFDLNWTRLACIGAKIHFEKNVNRYEMTFSHVQIVQVHMPVRLCVYRIEEEPKSIFKSFTIIRADRFAFYCCLERILHLLRYAFAWKHLGFTSAWANFCKPSNKRTEKYRKRKRFNAEIGHTPSKELRTAWPKSERRSK